MWCINWRISFRNITFASPLQQSNIPNNLLNQFRQFEVALNLRRNKSNRESSCTVTNQTHSFLRKELKGTRNVPPFDSNVMQTAKTNSVCLLMTQTTLAIPHGLSSLFAGRVYLGICSSLARCLPIISRAFRETRRRPEISRSSLAFFPPENGTIGGRRLPAEPGRTKDQTRKGGLEGREEEAFFI